MSSFKILEPLYAQPIPAGGSPETTATTAAPAGTQGAPTEPQQPAAITTLLFPVLLIAIFYFLMIRPTQKKEKARIALIKKLTKGDKVITKGGILGVVSNVKSDEGVAVIKVADNVRIEILMDYIATVNPGAEESKAVASPKK